MSFGESVFIGLFNQKTIKVDLFVKVNLVCRSLLSMSVSHRLLDHIYIVLLSRFDPRIQN